MMPDAPGVYFFYHGKNILYIGKATSLKDRVKSYFSRDILLTRGPRIEKMLKEADKIDYVETDSVLEALILEAAQIKKHQPRYNAREKDDKSYNFITITDEDYPQVLVTRGAGTYGPFPHGGELKVALKIIRKIFPYRDAKCKLTGKPCFNAQIGLCPGPCANWITKKDYRTNIRHLSKFLSGKKDDLVKDLEKEMKSLAKVQKFEEAEKVKRTLYALEHIQDIALIKRDLERVDGGNHFRIEAYDIAHISGTNVVGVMTVVEDGELNKSQYRKFKINGVKNPARPDASGRSGGDDTNNLKEVIRRRLGHPEWPMPNLMVVDGGVGQLNAANAVLNEVGLDIDVVAVTKDERHKAKEILPQAKKLKSQEFEKLILLANSEAHRFAISYHRKLRSKGFRI